MFFYVYPLKFLVVGLFGHFDAVEARLLLTIFGAGFSAVHGLFLLLYVHVYRLRQSLALNAVEVSKTAHTLINNIALTSAGLMSVALAWLLPLTLVAYAGYFYVLLVVYSIAARLLFGRRHRRLAQVAVDS